MSNEVEEQVCLNEPNLLAEIYRKFQPSSIPLQIEKHLNFIDFAEDGCMLVGSSTLNGRYWTGSVHYFDEAITDIRKDNCLTGLNCQAVVTDGKFISSKEKVVIGEDSGCISLLTIAELDEVDSKTIHVVVNVSTFDHDSVVLSLSVSPDKRNVVSGSMDKCIKIWDTEGLITLCTFRPAHAHSITSVQHLPSSDDVFASCSLDGCALVWDVRLDKPATVIKNSEREGLGSLSWNPVNSNVLAVGSNFGNISLYDVRSLSCITSNNVFTRPLHKMAFNSLGLLAACGDTNEVKVLDCKDSCSLNLIYNDVRHEDFVRGLSWHQLNDSVLYSCGWDTKVFSHNLDRNI